MKPYTVIAVYPCGQRYCGWIYAASPEQAAIQADEGEEELGMEIVAVIEGYHTDVLSGSHTVYVDDLRKGRT